MQITFNKPYISENAFNYMQDAINKKHISGDGCYTKKCHEWLEKFTGSKKALLTHSCTAALEMAAILIDIKAGDEVIMPSYTFVSTANAFVLRGAVPVFVDIRPDTLNINEDLIESAITDKTKAIVPVHYAGVPCEMDKIMEIAEKYNLYVIEDAAQGICSEYKGKSLGTIGHMGTLSFHETKNIISGEGGALLINDDRFIERAEIVREKGTNRSKFFRGQVDKYTWVDIGSSYLPSDLIAACLYSQFEVVESITEKRLSVWNKYKLELKEFESKGLIKLPFVPDDIKFNAHMFYILLNSLKERTDFINYLKEQEILSVFHYIPLHSAPAGIKYGRVGSEMENTNSISDTLVRLPLFFQLSDEDHHYIINSIKNFMYSYYKG